jgi:hypothetical protein
MSLRIHFVKKKTDYEPDVALGEIVLDDFVERFETPLTFWDADRYESQWRQGIDRLLAGAQKSCLITSMLEPKYEHFGTWWVLYRDGQRVVVQNQLLLLDVIGSDFDPDQPYAFIRDRISLSADGEPISEWLLNFNDISRLQEPSH